MFAALRFEVRPALLRLLNEAIMNTNLTSGAQLDDEFDIDMDLKPFPKILKGSMRGDAAFRYAWW